MLRFVLSRAGQAGSHRVHLATMSSSASAKLAGKVAIVSASTEGIGYAIARRLGLDGAKVMVSSRKQKNVDKALTDLKNENIEVSGMVCHVGKAEHRQKLVEETVKQFGGIDIFVSNAASNPSFGPILDTSPEVWDKIFDTNIKSAFFLCQDIVPHMEKRGGGSIVFVSSITGYQPMEMLGPYSVSKTALLGLVKAMAPQCGTKNIRVNAIAPGIIKTNFSSALTENDKMSDMILKTVPLARFGNPDDCAGIVSYLASDDSSYVTGETICVTGGMHSRL